MARMLYVVDNTGDELWRSTVAEPTATADFEKVLDFPSGIATPLGITSHADRLYVVDLDIPDELWRSTVSNPTATADWEKVLNFPSGLTAPLGITSHADRLYVTDNTGDELWRSTVAEPTLTSHFEKVLDFPSGLTTPTGITSHADRLYVLDNSSPDELWRSTVTEPTATAHFEKVLDFPAGLTFPQGFTSHADRLYVADDTGDELWRSTVSEPTDTTHFEEVLNFPSGLTSPNGIASHDPDPAPLEAAGEVRAQNPQISAATVVGTETGPWELSEWDRSNLAHVEFAAQVESGGSGTTLYAIPPRGTVGSLVDGELGVGTGDAPITRIQWSGDRLNFNDNTGSYSWDDDYGATGTKLNQYIRVQTEEHGFAEHRIGSITRSQGGNWLTFIDPPADMVTILDGIGGGTLFIVGFFDLAPLDATAEMESDDPEIIAAATLGPHEIQGIVTADDPAISANATLEALAPLAGAGTVTADNPSVSANATNGPLPGSQTASGTVTAANPSVSGNANLGPLPGGQVGAGTVTAANPSVVGNANLGPLPGGQVGAGTVTSANPSVTGAATLGGEPTPAAGAATITADDPGISAAATLPTLLTLADFDETGLVVTFAALILAGDSSQSSGVAPYNDSTNWALSGTILDGDLEYIAGGSVSRILYVAASTTLRFNDNPDAADIGAFFESGAGNGQKIFLQTEPGSRVEFDVNTALGSLSRGGNWINFNPPTPFDTAIGGLLANQRFIIALASDALNVAGTVTADNAAIQADADLAGAVTPLAAAGAVTAANPSVTGDANLGPLPGSQVGAGTVTADNPSLAAAAALGAAPQPVAGAGTVTAANPDVRAEADLAGATTPLATRGVVTADNPSLTANAVFDVRVAAGTVTASDPSITAAATIVAAGAALAGAGTLAADNPSLSAVATLAAAPTPTAASGTVAAQNPSLAADAQLAGAQTALAGAGEVTADDPAISAAATLGMGAGTMAAGGTVTARNPFITAAATTASVAAALAGAGTVTADNPAIAADASLGGVPAAGTVTADDPSLTGAATLTTVGAALSATGTVTSANPLVFALDRTPLAVEIAREDEEIVAGQTVIHLQALTSPATSQTLTYQWAASSGTFDDPTLRTVRWTARRNPLESQDVTFNVHVRSPFFTAAATYEETVLPSGTIAGRIDTDAIAALLVTQWDDATRLQALAAELLAIVDEELTTPLIELEQTTRIATAEGEWLDRIGVRLGVDRPFTADMTFARFGFDGSDGVGFDQGPFDSVISALVNTVPVGDAYYRCLLGIRGRALLGSGSVPDLEAMLVSEFDNVRVEDNADGTVTVRNVANDTRQELATIVEAVIRQAMPAGVAVTIEDP